MDAVSMMESYGNYPIANVFSNNEQDLPIPAANESMGSSKRHSACDECRKRKLKCSGEPTGCTRCVKNTLICIYSEQKQMGRPKKRQRTDDEPENLPPDVTTSQKRQSVMIDPSLSTADIERTQLQNICNVPIAQTIRRSAASNSQRSSSMNNSPPSDRPRTPSDNDIYAQLYPTDYSQWPDFSDTDVPLPVLDGFGTKDFSSRSKHDNSMASNSSQFSLDPDVDPNYLQDLPSIPDCPCLPNLYLTLSTLSTLSAFPVSAHTITTLCAAHRTARSVLYCPICPQKFQSGSQNVMLSGTLLTVLVDQWARVLKCPAPALRKGFGDPTDTSPLTHIQDLEWRTFSYHLTRHFVFADHPLPTSPGPVSPALQFCHSTRTLTPSLMSLADSMERRQKQWHSFDEPSGEFPRRMTTDLAAGHTGAVGLTLEEIRKYERENVKDQGHLCLQLVRHTKMCIRSLDKAVPVLE